MKLLVIEDNARLAERIHRKLYKLHSIDLVENGHEALMKVKNVQYDVILLDLGLPDLPGVEVCKKIREINNAPIMVVTGMDTTESRVNLLDCGADDYITKPFDSTELRARIDALGRRKALREPRTVITYGDLTIDVDQRQVFRAGTEIVLRRKEFDILEYLVSNKGRVMTREMIMNHAWDSDKISWSSTVDVHIKHLRDKVDRPFDFPIIKTAYGLGYRVDLLD